MDWIEALALGIVQGLTEFLPISSDGHLKITQGAFNYALGRSKDIEDELFFDVMLHVGTLIAILLHYRGQIRAGIDGLLADRPESPAPFKRTSVVRVGVLAAIATLPLVPDQLFFLKWIKLAFRSNAATGAGFLVTAAVLLVTVRLKGGRKGPAETTWLDALLVGVAQMFAPLPGVSRSGLTISAALALGFSKAWAVSFSLMMAVLAIAGATALHVLKVDLAALTAVRVGQVVAGAAVAGIIGYLAIVWLARLVRSERLWYFSVYLVVLGLALIATDRTVVQRGHDGRPANALEQPARAGRPRPGDPPGRVQAGPVDRPLGAGSRPVGPAPGGGHAGA